MAPLGSATTETRNGGTIAARAASNMLTASSNSRPPIKIAVRLTPSGPREKMVSWVKSGISSSVTLL